MISDDVSAAALRCIGVLRDQWIPIAAVIGIDPAFKGFGRIGSHNKALAACAEEIPTDAFDGLPMRFHRTGHEAGALVDAVGQVASGGFLQKVEFSDDAAVIPWIVERFAARVLV